jgi:hypothetical protein
MHGVNAEGNGNRMGIALTREQVLALAPDDSSVKAASGLVSDSKWGLLGADDDAVWGECQGSGSKPYRAQVDLAALVSRCSCPSRKFPCKHGLALLLLYSQGNPRFSSAVRPDWVEEWLASRRDRAEKKQKADESAAAQAAADPAIAAAARAKREGARWKRIEQGTVELQRWIADQFRRGLARFGPEQHKDWLAMAARMVDAQAPGLAPRIQEALELMASGGPRHADVVERLGLLQLVVEGVIRREQLSPSRLADLRAVLGWAPDKEEVTAAGEAVMDNWCVLGMVATERDAKLSERRVWLQGMRSGRQALLQDFAYGGRGWDQGWRHGGQYAATLHFYPGSVPLRAVGTDVQPGGPVPMPVYDDADAAIESASLAFSRNPWLAQVPLVVPSATVMRQEAGWSVRTVAGVFRIEIGDAAAWGLMAFSGGHSVHLMGEWDGHVLRVLSAWDASGSRWALETGA